MSYLSFSGHFAIVLATNGLQDRRQIERQKKNFNSIGLRSPRSITSTISMVGGIKALKLQSFKVLHKLAAVEFASGVRTKASDQFLQVECLFSDVFVFVEA
jgi:hypothetical protein